MKCMRSRLGLFTPSHSSGPCLWSSERILVPSICQRIGRYWTFLSKKKTKLQHTLTGSDCSIVILLHSSWHVEGSISEVKEVQLTHLSTHSFTTAKFPSPITFPTWYLSLMMDDDTERFPFTARWEEKRHIGVLLVLHKCSTKAFVSASVVHWNNPASVTAVQSWFCSLA